MKEGGVSVCIQVTVLAGERCIYMYTCDSSGNIIFHPTFWSLLKERGVSVCIEGTVLAGERCVYMYRGDGSGRREVCLYV